MTLDPIQLTQKLIHCPSITPKEEGVLDVLGGELEKLGFTCHRLVFEEEGTEPVDNLYASIGSGSPHLSFAGHVDVVPPGDTDAWTYPPFEAQIHNGIMFGRGTEDMKGAIGAFVAAVSGFLAERQGFKGTISLLIAGDEEGSARNGTKKMLPWLKERGEIMDACIVGEPTNPEKLGQMMKVGRRGSMNCQLTIFGKQGHAAYPHLANNPITPLMNILHTLKHTVWDEGTEHFQPSNLEITTIDVGNPAVNVIPAKAVAKFNIRFNDKHISKELEAKIRAVCAAQHIEFDLQVRVSGEAFLSTPGPFAKLVAQAIKDVTGLNPDISTSGGTSDARFIKDYCPVVEFGTTGKTAHMVDENVEVETLLNLSKVYRTIINRYFAA